MVYVGNIHVWPTVLYVKTIHVKDTSLEGREGPYKNKTCAHSALRRVCWFKTWTQEVFGDPSRKGCRLSLCSCNKLEQQSKQRQRPKWLTSQCSEKTLTPEGEVSGVECLDSLHFNRHGPQIDLFLFSSQSEAVRSKLAVDYINFHWDFSWLIFNTMHVLLFQNSWTAKWRILIKKSQCGDVEMNGKPHLQPRFHLKHKVRKLNISKNELPTAMQILEAMN